MSEILNEITVLLKHFRKMNSSGLPSYEVSVGQDEILLSTVNAFLELVEKENEKSKKALIERVLEVLDWLPPIGQLQIGGEQWKDWQAAKQVVINRYIKEGK